MILRCPVTLNNELVTVVDVNGSLVQIPAIHRKASEVNILIKNGQFNVVDDNYVEPKNVDEQIDNKQKNKKNKKTTVNEKGAKCTDNV